MDDLLPKFLSFPPHPPPQAPLSDHIYDEGIKALISYMKAVPDTKLLQQTSGGENTLDVSNITQLPYEYSNKDLGDQPFPQYSPICIHLARTYEGSVQERQGRESRLCLG